MNRFGALFFGWVGLGGDKLGWMRLIEGGRTVW